MMCAKFCENQTKTVGHSCVQHPTQHIIGHFRDDFTGRTTQPTVSQH